MKGIDFQIERLRLKSGLSYIDCVVDFAAERGIDVEDVAEQLGESIKIHLQHEFAVRHMVKDKQEFNDNTSLKDFFD